MENLKIVLKLEQSQALWKEGLSKVAPIFLPNMQSQTLIIKSNICLLHIIWMSHMEEGFGLWMTKKVACQDIIDIIVTIHYSI